MVTGSNAICITPSCSPRHGVTVVLGSWRKGKVHEVSDGRLTPPAIRVSHGSLFLLAYKFHEGNIGLTASAIVSSSMNRDFLEFLCCFL